jgi:hypothetical protein
VRGITKIIYVEDLKRNTPASVDRNTGVLYINLKIWNKIKVWEHRFFILLHEYAHVALNTSDELAVDEYAFKLYAQRGLSLTKSVTALADLLNANNKDHCWRTYKQLERAKEFDYKHNGNKNVYNEHH